MNHIVHRHCHNTYSSLLCLYINLSLHTHLKIWSIIDLRRTLSLNLLYIRMLDLHSKHDRINKLRTWLNHLHYILHILQPLCMSMVSTMFYPLRGRIAKPRWQYTSDTYLDSWVHN